jgi:hypothetical protein
MTEELPPPQAAARMLSVASDSHPVPNGPFNGREFTDLTDANDEKSEMIDMAMSEPQLILAERWTKSTVSKIQGERRLDRKEQFVAVMTLCDKQRHAGASWPKTRIVARRLFASSVGSPQARNS